MGNVIRIPSNKTMVDQLVDEMTLSPRVESAFRAVDRAIYCETKDDKLKPYAMSPWREGDLHISAPSIYTRVVEALDLKPGMSFLNLGSGTGYLSTVVGLLIAPRGINHGVEVHEQVVKYSQRKLAEFLTTSSAIDKFEFVKPHFIHGNCVNLNPDRQYDRVYLGAECLPAFENLMKRLIKPNGGILIMPMDDELVLYKRLADDQWEKQTLEALVQFTTMRDRIHADDKQMIEMPSESVPELKLLCREAIRRQLRLKTDLMHPNLLNSDNVERRRHRRSVAMKRAEERYLKQSNMKSSQYGPNSVVRRSSGACTPYCGYEMCSRTSCRHKRLLLRPGPGNRMMIRQATHRGQSGIWAREMAGGTSSSSYADVISDLDANTERDDDFEDDDDSENAFLSSRTSDRRLQEARDVHPPGPISRNQASSSGAHHSRNNRESSTTIGGSSSRQSDNSRPRNSVGQDSSSSARGERLVLDQILIDPLLRSSIIRSRSFSPTLDGVRTARSRLNQSIQDQSDQERIESALWHLMHRGDRRHSPPQGRDQEADEGFPDPAEEHFWADPVNPAHHHQEELDRVLLALYWTKFLKSALGDDTDDDDDDEDDDEDFIMPTRESSTEPMDHSSSSSSSTSLDSDCPSNSSSLSTSSFASSDNDECAAQDRAGEGFFVNRSAPAQPHASEEPMGRRLRSKRPHLSSAQSLKSTSSSSLQSGLKTSTTKTEVVKKSASSRTGGTRSSCCKRHQCCRRRVNTCHRLIDLQQEQRPQHQLRQHQRLTHSRRGELEPYAGCRHLSPAFMGGGANMSIEGRILLATGFNLHRTGASLSLVNANGSIQQEMRQPILFMNALAHSSDNWPASSWQSMNLCNCVGTFGPDDHLRPSSQQRVSHSPPASSTGPSDHRAPTFAADRRHRQQQQQQPQQQQQQQSSYLGFIGCKRKRHSSESDSSDRDDIDDDDYHGSPNELPSCSRICSRRSTRPLFQDHVTTASSRGGGSVGGCIEAAGRCVCNLCNSSCDLRSSGARGVAHQAPRSQTATLRSCDSIKSTDDGHRLRPLAARSLSSRSTSGAALAANIDDGQPRPGAPAGRQPCRHHQQELQANYNHCHHHCRHHHKHRHHHAHCRHQRGLEGLGAGSQKRRRDHHCKRHRRRHQHRHCCQRHGRQTNHQAPGERPADFHVRRRVERERRHTAVHNGRSSASNKRPLAKPGNECDKYRSHISGYIRQLDLPASLLHYLNYDRQFE